jgi:hypothetical protein
MDFNIPGPTLAVDFNRGIEEVWAGISVKGAGMNNPDTLTIGSCKIRIIPQPMLPNELHQFFH